MLPLLQERSMVDSKKKLNQFVDNLTSSKNKNMLDKISKTNPSILEDIKKLDETLANCAPAIEKPAISPELIITPTLPALPGQTPVVDIPGNAGTVLIEKPVFAPPKITPGISNIRISTGKRKKSIRKKIEKDIKLSDKLPLKLSKDNLRDRKIIELFDKNYINTFSITSQKNRLLSKNVLSVNDEIYKTNIQDYISNVAPDKNSVFLPDNLRGRTGGFWTLNEKDKNLIFINQYSEYFSKKPLEYLFLPIEDDTSQSAFGRTVQSLALKGKTKHFLSRNNTFSSNLYKKYIEGGTYQGDTSNKDRSTIIFNPTVARNLTFFDYAHEYAIPYTKKELENVSSILKPLIADTQPEYGFYIKNYENVISSSNISELILPNMYVFLSQIFETNPNPEFKTFLELDGLISNNSTAIIDSNKNIKNSSEYFDLYSRNVQNLNTETKNKYINKFKNIVFPVESLYLLKNYFHNKDVFPMNLGIEFSTDNTTVFTEILKNSNFSNVFLIKMIESLLANKFTTSIFDNSTQTVSSQSFTKDDEVVKNQKLISTFNRTNKKYIELETILKNMFEEQQDFSDQFIYFGNYSEDYIKTFNNEYKLFKNLMNIVFSSKLQEFVKNNFRTYQEMIGGALAYSETLMYRMAKYEGDISGEQALNSEPIQNIYFANSNTIDIVNFVDTQVKYNKQYTYIVYAYNLVLGNKYLYSELDNSLSPDIATLSVYSEPSPVIVEEQYYTSTKKIFDYPPVFPDLQFIPIKGVDNQVRININSNVGMYNIKPIVINQADQNKFEEITRNQELIYGDPIKFKSDDQATQFEIYRTDFQPESYADFAGNLVAKIDTDVSPESAQSATAASYIDDIQPNKKYYYIARTVDVHGNISNPTEMIQLEVINENGTIFMTKKPGIFAEKKKEPTKNIKRFIEIKPSSTQTAINEEKSGLVDAKSTAEIKNKIILGKVDTPVWGKTFVMKVISKSTGKKIDFKFKFEYEEVKE